MDPTDKAAFLIHKKFGLYGEGVSEVPDSTPHPFDTAYFNLLAWNEQAKKGRAAINKLRRSKPKTKTKAKAKRNVKRNGQRGKR